MSVRVTFLGGLGEVGRNCATIEVGGRIALLDCGLMFPEEDMVGVDLVFPDFGPVVERAGDVECVVLTHGHEDHIGALAYFLQEVNVPVFGTPLSVELARGRIEEAGVKADLRPVETGEWVEQGPLRFKLIQVSHSVPQGAGVAFDTPEGIVVHSGDFKLDPTPIDGRPTDLPAFAELGNRGVRLLLADSTNAEDPGFVPSESSLAQPLYEIIVEARRRLVAACFSSHLHRVQQIVDGAVDAGRYVAFLGRSMIRNVSIAEQLGLIKIPPDSVLPIEELLVLPPERTAVVCTGSQGEPFAALSLMAAGEHRWVDVEPDDTVLISARPIPGNETRVSRVISGLLRLGANVFHGRNARVHVSGHGAQEELKTFLNVVRPLAFVPIHGEYRHLRAHAELASQMRVPEVLLCEDGDSVVLEEGGIRRERQAVPAGYLFVEGLEVGGVGQGVLRDRQRLSVHGVVVAAIVIDAGTGQVLRGPDFVSHGLADDPGPILSKARDPVLAAVQGAHRPLDLEELREQVRQAVKRTIRDQTGRKPMVLVVLIETY
ncbi:MAG: ribonuclease J [Acidimicrobiia bacterium]